MLGMVRPTLGESPSTSGSLALSRLTTRQIAVGQSIHSRSISRQADQSTWSSHVYHPGASQDRTRFRLALSKWTTSGACQSGLSKNGAFARVSLSARPVEPGRVVNQDSSCMPAFLWCCKGKNEFPTRKMKINCSRVLSRIFASWLRFCPLAYPYSQGSQSVSQIGKYRAIRWSPSFYLTDRGYARGWGSCSSTSDVNFDQNGLPTLLYHPKHRIKESSYTQQLTKHI